MPAVLVAAVSDGGNVSFQVSTFPTSTRRLAGTGELSRIHAARTSAPPHTGQLRSSRETSCGQHHFPSAGVLLPPSCLYSRPQRSGRTPTQLNLARSSRSSLASRSQFR